jgi:hypothetical protein
MRFSFLLLQLPLGYHQFYFGVLGLHVVAFGFVWFVGCGCLECSCWGGSSVVCWSASLFLSEESRSSSYLFVIYVTTLSNSDYIASNDWLIANNELENVLKEAVVA